MTTDATGGAGSAEGRAGATGADTATGRAPDPVPGAGQVRALIVVRAVLMLIFGAVMLFSPGIAVLALIYTFAAYAVVDGIATVVLGIRTRDTRPGWGWAVAQGVISVLAGVVAFTLPGSAALALLFVIAFWAIAAGVVTAVSAFEVRKHGGPWGWIAARAVLDVLFGVALLAWPASGILALIWLVGWFAIVGGVFLLVQAFGSRHHPAVG